MKKRPFLVSFALLLASISPSVMVNANIASARDLGNHGTKSGNEVKSVAQSKKITGTVVDAAGVPIIGANVIVVALPTVQLQTWMESLLLKMWLRVQS